jgi:RNA polymerase sigma factor (sigma-70 family)
MASGQSTFPHLRRAALLQDGGGMTDGQLLECFLTRRDEAAFEALVRRHGPMVWGVCRRVLPHRQDAEDAFQAAFLVLVRKAASIRRRELVGNWLYGTAYRAALEAKAARKRLARERQVSTMPEPEAAEERDVSAELRPVLDRELSRLPEKYRLAVVLCDLEGRTRRDVARQLGIPAGTLSGRLTTARRMLAKRLAAYRLSLPGGLLAAVLSERAASAGVPASLVSSTVQAASGLAAGGAVTSGLVSARVAALTEGVMKAMFLTKLKIITLALVLVATVGIGVGGLAHQIRAGGGPADESAKSRADKETAKDSQRLQGTWTIVSVADGGRKARPEQLKGAKVVFEKDRFKLYSSADRVKVDATYRLDPSARPPAIDFSRPGRGTELGIYEVKGDELRICINELSATDRKRPTRFASEKDSANDVLILARRARVLDARQTAMAFLTAALAGKTKEAAALGQPGQGPSRPKKVEELAPFKGQNVAIARLHADEANALAVTGPVILREHRGARKGMIQLTLVKKDGRWLVRDIDFETEESAKAELQRFLAKHPGAKQVPEKKK